MTVLITLTIAEGDSGPFDLYSNIDGYKVPFSVNISKSALLAGYADSNVPDNASTIRVKSKGACANYIDISTVYPSSYEIQGCRSGNSFYAEMIFPYTIGEIVYFGDLNRALGGYCGTIISFVNAVPTVLLLGTKPTDCGDVNCITDM